MDYEGLVGYLRQRITKGRLRGRLLPLSRKPKRRTAILEYVEYVAREVLYESLAALVAFALVGAFLFWFVFYGVPWLFTVTQK